MNELFVNFVANEDSALGILAVILGWFSHKKFEMAELPPFPDGGQFAVYCSVSVRRLWGAFE
ncbi:MAG: hypothetical protein N2379_07790 [Verrucomicrobiae bacterium]|nr:hypothetical protein [Verrucomicrobiae bacterium]